GYDPSCPECTVTVIAQAPALTLTKDAAAGTYDSVGDVINYTLILTNTGNVTLTGIAVTDANADAGSITPATIATLAPGAVVNISATHTITQGDLNAGWVYNSALATAQDPAGEQVSDTSSAPTSALQPGDQGYDPSCPECTVTVIAQAPALTLTKDAAAGTYDSVGDVINYTLVLTNTGNVTLTGIAVTDANADAGSITPATIATLTPGALVNISSTHTRALHSFPTRRSSDLALATAQDPAGEQVSD